MKDAFPAMWLSDNPEASSLQGGRQCQYSVLSLASVPRLPFSALNEQRTVHPYRSCCPHKGAVQQHAHCRVTTAHSTGCHQQHLVTQTIFPCQPSCNMYVPAGQPRAKEYGKRKINPNVGLSVRPLNVSPKICGHYLE
jgi:hypothetical protein